MDTCNMLNKQLGISTKGKRRRVSENEEEGYRTGIDPAPPKPKHARRKYCVVNDDVAGPRDSIRDVLLDLHPKAFNEIHVRRKVYSFLGLGDAIRLCLRNLLVARMSLRLSENADYFAPWEAMAEYEGCVGIAEAPQEIIDANTKAIVQDLSGNDMKLQFLSHHEFADAYFADIIRKIVRFGSILCIPWVLDVRNSYQTGVSVHVVAALNESVLYCIQKNEFAKFQWLLELNDVRFDRTWLQEVIERDAAQFVEHLLFKYTVRRSVEYATFAKSIAMMELLWKYKFPFTAKVTNKFIAQRDQEKVTWLLARGVQEDRDTKVSEKRDKRDKEKEPLYLEQAINVDNYAAIEKLAEFGFPCSTQLLAKTLLQGKLTAIEYLYKCFFSTKRTVFDNMEEHHDFLIAFVSKVVPLNQTSEFVANPNALAVLRYMDEEHCNDLSFSLLYSTLIRYQFTGPLHELFKIHPHSLSISQGSLSVNHMDEAILLESDQIVNWLLEKKIACSQLGMVRLVESDKAWKWTRIQHLLNHPVCVHLQLQPLWPTIQQELRPSTEFRLVPMKLCPLRESEDVEMECL